MLCGGHSSLRVSGLPILCQAFTLSQHFTSDHGCLYVVSSLEAANSIQQPKTSAYSTPQPNQHTWSGPCFNTNLHVHILMLRLICCLVKEGGSLKRPKLQMDNVAVLLHHCSAKKLACLTQPPLPHCSCIVLQESCADLWGAWSREGQHRSPHTLPLAH